MAGNIRRSIQALGDAAAVAQAIQARRRPGRRRPPPLRRPCAGGCRRCRAGPRPRSGRRSRSWQTRRRLEVPTARPGRQPRQAAPLRLTSASRGSARGGMATSPARRQLRGHVFQAVHRQVDPAVGQRHLDLLHPDPLPPTSTSGPSEAVALGHDDLLLDLQPGVGLAQGGGHVVGLPAGQGAAARADDQLPGVASLTPAPRLPLGLPRRPPGSSLVGSSHRLHRRQVEQAVRGLHQWGPSPPLGGVLLQRHRGRVQQLGDDGLGHRGHRPLGALVRAGQAGQRLLRLGAGDPHSAPQRGDGRAGRAPACGGQEQRELLVDQRLGAIGLLAPVLQVLAHHLLQVVDVVEVDPLQIAHLRLDVAGDGDVDEHQRPRRAGALHASATAPCPAPAGAPRSS